MMSANRLNGLPVRTAKGVRVLRKPRARDRILRRREIEAQLSGDIETLNRKVKTGAGESEGRLESESILVYSAIYPTRVDYRIRSKVFAQTRLYESSLVV